MKKAAEDHIKDKRFELLIDLLLADDRQDISLLKEELLEAKNFKSKVDPFVDAKIEDLRQNFPVYFGDTITETIKVQIKESQDEVVEALYPIMGKLVKKFIASEIAKLFESINNTINEKFSVKSIIKRFFKGKKTNAEDVLQEVFEPVVEELFVIGKESGLLIGSYSRGNIADKDMVSGMLTAIKAFAEDAFSKEGQDLEDIKFETFQLSMMNFKSIYLATATSGVLNAEFKDRLTDSLNNLADTILRNRDYLADESKLNNLLEEVLKDLEQK
tara:strand:- start:692 stop:1510 length:819 start_codon:yes stop_codon:yes gene_type:complete